MSDDTADEIDVVEEYVPGGALSPDAARKIDHAKVLPLHTASGSHTKNLAGRAKGVKVHGRPVGRPTVDQLKYLAEMQEAEVRFVESDPIVLATRNQASSKDVFRLLVIQAAQNAASLEFQRIEMQKRGEETTNIIGRHTKVLKEVASLQAELKELNQAVIDPRSESFQKVFKLWVEKIQTVIGEVLTPEQADLFLTKFATSMDNWEEQVESVLR